MSTILAYVFFGVALFFLWTTKVAFGLFQDELKKRESLELLHGKKLPDSVSLFDNPLAFAINRKLTEAHGLLDRYAETVKARNKQIEEDERSRAVTVTCLANFGYIPEKFNDGSQLHRAINEAIERARKEHVQDPV